MLGLFAGRLLHWSTMESIFLGCMISISSTTIIVKTFDELNLKTKKFVEVVFGILIIEDLAAILMLVGLTNIITSSQIGAMELFLAAGKLAVVIGGWFLIGIFIVPRVVKSVDRHGNDEMLTIVISNYITSDVLTRSIAWALAFILSSPSIWGMLSAFRVKAEGRGHGRVDGRAGGRWILSGAVTIALVAILSTEYFSLVHIFSASLIVYGILFLLLRRQIDSYYQWIETQFKSGFQADVQDADKQKIHAKLAPWDAHLVELRIPPRSLVVGQSLSNLQIRERYGVNIVTIIRDGENIVAPNANEILYPGDRVLCFATDAEIEQFEESVRSPDTSKIRPSEADEYKLQRVKITDGSPLNHMSIRSSGIGENFGCIVVGMERSGDRIRSPKPDLVLVENDILWIAGGVGNLERLSKRLG